MFFPLLAYHHQIIMYSWRIPVLSFLAKSNMHFINNNTWGRTTERVRSHCGEKINFVPTSKVWLYKYAFLWLVWVISWSIKNIWLVLQNIVWPWPEPCRSIWSSRCSVSTFFGCWSGMMADTKSHYNVLLVYQRRGRLKRPSASLGMWSSTTSILLLYLLVLEVAAFQQNFGKIGKSKLTWTEGAILPKCLHE